MKTKVILLIFLLINTSINIYAQKSDGIKPKWVTGKLPSSINGSTEFVKAHGEGLSLEAAREMALLNLSDQFERKREITVDTKSIQTERLHESGKKGTASYEYSQDVTLQVEESGKKIPVKCRAVDEYWTKKNGVYSIDILYAVPATFYFGIDQINARFDQPALNGECVVFKNTYPEAGIMSIIPGVGQLYKGSTAKGYIFLGLEAAAAVAIVVAENNRSSYKNKMIEQPKFAQQYQERADNWETVRNVTIGVAGAVYVWNLLDAFVAKGARRVILKKDPRYGNTTLSITPTASLQDVGLAFQINF